MKKLVILSILFYWVISSFSQNYRWEVIHGVSNRNESAEDIIEDYDNGYYVSGFKYIGWQGDGWNIKTDVNGNALYDKILKHDDHTISIWGAATDKNGNKYVCAPTFSDMQWPYVLKFDSCGNLAWCKMLYDDNFYRGSALDILINSNNEIVVLTLYDSESRIENIHLVVLDTNGKELWKKPYASQNNYPLIRETVAYKIVEHNTNYYMSGFCYYPYPNNPNHLFLRPMFIGIDSLFNEKFVLPFMKRDSVFGDAFVSIPLNDTIIMGAGVRRAYGSNNETNALLMFFSNDGEELGYNVIYNDLIGVDIRSSSIYDIASINDTMFIAVSHFGPEMDGNPAGELVIDTAGFVYGSQPHPDHGAASIIKTSDDNYVIAANKRQNNSTWYDILLYKIDQNLESVPFDTVTHTYDSLCPHTIQSETIDLTECLVITDIGELPGPAQYYESLRWIPIKAFPNPVKDGKVTLEFENTDHHYNMELQIYNNTGHSIHSQKIYKGQQDTDVNVSAWTRGVYIVVIYSNGGAVGKVKFVIN
jgi:hypothetical protein